MHFLMVGQIVAHCPSFWNYFRFKMNMICESWGCIFASLHSRPRLGKMSTFSANLLVPRSRIFVGWGNDKILWSSETRNQQLSMADFDLWSSCSIFWLVVLFSPHPYIIDLPLCRSICVLWNGQSSTWTMRLENFVVRGVHTWISWISVGSWQLPLSFYTHTPRACVFSASPQKCYNTWPYRIQVAKRLRQEGWRLVI